ncbi:MAG TPA: hypothetical protein VEF71_07930 [Streptosporangiaceae bacterium]|nr:hypothetical protein [Streptosporangiaceae bacterium]
MRRTSTSAERRPAGQADTPDSGTAQAAGQDELFPAWRYHAVFTDSHCEPAANGIRGERIFEWLDQHMPA